MARFDPDYSIFGILAGDLVQGIGVEQTKIDYANRACLEIYGDLIGMEFGHIFTEIAGSEERARPLLQQFQARGKIAFEGRLSGKFVKFHCRIIDCRDDDACPITQFIQAGITDITESVVLKRLLQGTSEALKRAAEAADEDTGQHIARINEYSRKLAELSHADASFVEEIGSFAQLHDIGKIKVAEIIRLPRRLEPHEWQEVKKHPLYGGKMVEGLDGLELAYDIIMDHHEKWDGSGYPNGKKQKEISFAGRIVGLVDVFDALMSERPYKKAYDYKVVKKVMQFGDGRVKPGHFDPQLLDIFLANFQMFVDIHTRMKM